MKRGFIYLIFTLFIHFSSAQENTYEAKMITFSQYVAQELPTFTKDGDKKIAVWDFTNIDKNNQNANFNDMLANDLQIYLFKQKVAVVDRYKFKGVREEIKILSDGLDKETAKKIAKLVPANAVLTGLYEIRTNDIKLNIRVQDIESNELIAGDILNIPLDNNIRKILGLEPECTKSNYTLRFEAKVFAVVDSWGKHYHYSNPYIHISDKLVENIPKILPRPKSEKGVIKRLYVNEKLTIASEIKGGEYYLLLTKAESGKVIDYKKINVQGCYDFHIIVSNTNIESIEEFKE